MIPLAGGLAPSPATAQTMFLDSNLHWRGPEHSQPLPYPRYGHCMVQIDDCKVAIIGGYDDGGNAITQIQVYNIDDASYEDGPK